MIMQSSNLLITLCTFILFISVILFLSVLFSLFLYSQGHSLTSHLTDEQRAEMKAYMSLVENIFVSAVVCRCT